MLHKLMEEDREKATEYLSLEPEYNLFFLGDIENHGFDAPYMEVWADDTNGEYHSIILRYFGFLIVYSRENEFDTAPFMQVLAQYPNASISGKRDLMKRLAGKLEGYEYKHTYLSCLKEVKMDIDTSGIEKGNNEDAEDITDLYCDTEEFTTRNRREEAIASTKKDMEKGTGRYLMMKEDGVLAAVAASSAEYSAAAIVIGVATRKGYRRKGYATKLVTALCRELLNEGKKYICLFYNNPEAGAIYKRIGFEDIGQWMMAERGFPCGA